MFNVLLALRSPGVIVLLPHGLTECEL
uniref:Uncharacterized protein n=1 Tax=Anguilla anguilla TaxID=7936 RepID=A0A0E9VVE8_ANGAN